MKSVAIITARGGSKRIPKKNIKAFCGKEIISYSIDAALSSGVFDEVMVSTDNEEIAETAKAYGANVPFLRSAKTSTDYATTSDVLEEVIYMYECLEKHFDITGCIYPTAPFITPQRLIEAMTKLISEGADCVLPVVRYSFPPQRAFLFDNDRVRFQYPEYAKTRSQDLEPLYHDCGQFYLLRTSALHEFHTIVPPNTIPLELPDAEVQDIDTLSDWETAELKFSMLRKKSYPAE